MYSGSWLSRILLYADINYKYAREICPPPVLGGWSELSAAGFPPGEFMEQSKLLFQIPNDCLCAGAYMELLKDLFDMPVHGPDTDAHCLSDLLVHISLA